MADDTLRIIARLDDQITGPLGKVEGSLKRVGTHGREAAAGIRKEWDALRGAIGTTNVALSGLSGPLSALGLAGGGAALSLAAVGGALRSFSQNTQSLEILAKQTGLTVETLRALENMGGRVGIAGSTMLGAADNFSAAAEKFKRGWGQAMQELAPMNLGWLANDLQMAKTKEEMLTKLFQALPKISNREARSRVLIMFFGTDEVDRIIQEYGDQAAKKLGEIRQQVGTIGPEAQKAAKEFEDMVGRWDAALGKAKIWALTPLLKGAVGAMEDFQTRGFFGPEKNKPASQAPSDLDEQLDAQMRGQKPQSKSQKDRANRINELEARLAGRRSELEYQDKRFPVRDEQEIRRLTDEVRKLSDELRRTREQGAGYSPTGFGGADGVRGLIQKAALGGAPFFGGGGYGGGSGGGGGGSAGWGSGGGSGAAAAGAGGGSDDGSSAGQPRGETGDARPWPGGAHVSPRAPVPFRDAFGRGPLGMGGEPRAGGAGAGGGSTPRGDGAGTRGSARMGQMMSWAMDQLRREGVPEQHLRQSAAHLVGQAFMESGLDPNKVHDGGTGYGIYGARDPTPGRGRRTSMLNWLQANGYARNSAEGQMRYMAREAMSGRYQATRRILMGGGSGNVVADTNRITGEFESPAIINHRAGAVQQAHRLGPENVPAGGPEQKGPLSDPAGPLSPSPDGTTGDMAFGDSIAHGLRSADRRLEGNTQPGISSKEVLKRILGTDPSKFKGKRVFLSSGLSNSPGDLESVRRQIAAIKAAGGRPVLMGAGPRPDLNDANGRLRGLAGEAGVDFQELGQTGDGVHPNNYGRVLGQLRQKGLPQGGGAGPEHGPETARPARPRLQAPDDPGSKLMKRFYGDAGGSASPGGTAPAMHAAAKGHLHITVDGPAGTKVAHSMDGLFRGVTLSRRRAPETYEA